MAASRRSAGHSRRQAISPDGSELLGLELQQIRSAESQLSEILPSLAEAVECEELRELLEQREQQGKRLLGEIESALDELEESPPEKRNVAARGLIEAAEEHMREIEEGPALDAVLVAGMQKVEHYCIAAWGTARSLAQATGKKTTVRAMDRALKEGKSLDEKLTDVAENEITPALLSEESEDEEGEEAQEHRAQPRRRGTSSRSTRHAPRH